MFRQKLILFLVLLFGTAWTVTAGSAPKSVNDQVIEITYNGITETIWLIPEGQFAWQTQPMHHLDGTILYAIGTDDLDQGLIHLIHNPKNSIKAKLMIEHIDSGERYFYNVYRGYDSVPYPLQFGDGTYAIKLYEQVADNRYRNAYARQIKLTLEDDHLVFLNSHLEIRWDTEDEAIQLAHILVNRAKRQAYIKANPRRNTRLIQPVDYKDVSLSQREIITIFYNYIIDNIVYDYEKIEGLSYDYLPDIDETLEVGSGICYDYSALFASMLRSQGIPTKLIKGYTTAVDVYHAWNQVYMEETGHWAVVDTTFDAYYKANKIAFDFEKSTDDYETSKYY